MFWESLGIKARALQRSGGKQTLTRSEISGTMPTSRSLCSSSVSNLNALFINENLSLHERIVKLNTIAINQMKLLTDEMGIRKNRGVVVRNDRGIWGYENGESVTQYFLIPGFPGFYFVFLYPPHHIPFLDDPCCKNKPGKDDDEHTTVNKRRKYGCP